MLRFLFPDCDIVSEDDAVLMDVRLSSDEGLAACLEKKLGKDMRFAVLVERGAAISEGKMTDAGKSVAVMEDGAWTKDDASFDVVV